MSIPNIIVNDPRIFTHPISNINIYRLPQPLIFNVHPPITLQIGFPIVELPGCVEFHPDDQNKVTRLPFDKNLVNDDPKGAQTACPNGQYPTYDAINFEPEQTLATFVTEAPPVEPPPPPEVPDTGDVVPPKVECPGPGQLRVGDTTQSGDEKVIGHKLSDDGKVCITLYEPTTPLEKYVPPLNQVSTVTALAVVATAGAAATPLLIRIIKPVIKKLWATIQKKLGKDVKRPSLSEIKTNKYREKEGLPPLKVKKK